MEIALTEGIAIGLSWEMIYAVENDGEICRDDVDMAITGGGNGADSGLKWWINIFTAYAWDGQEDPE